MGRLELLSNPVTLSEACDLLLTPAVRLSTQTSCLHQVLLSLSLSLSLSLALSLSLSLSPHYFSTESSIEEHKRTVLFAPSLSVSHRSHSLRSLIRVMLTLYNCPCCISPTFERLLMSPNWFIKLHYNSRRRIWESVTEVKPGIGRLPQIETGDKSKEKPESRRIRTNADASTVVQQKKNHYIYLLFLIDVYCLMFYQFYNYIFTFTTCYGVKYVYMIRHFEKVLSGHVISWKEWYQTEGWSTVFNVVRNKT